MNDDQRLHLQFIQGVITRMNSNSTSMKSWMVAILSALLALYASSNNNLYLWVANAPVFLFWLFDTYYLKMERQYRELYNKVITGNSSVTTYSMDASKECVCFGKTLFRPIEVGFYFPIIIGLILAALFV